MSNYQIVANYFGSVFLNQNHVIDNVLYIPNFVFNLLFWFDWCWCVGTILNIINAWS